MDENTTVSLPYNQYQFAQNSFMNLRLDTTSLFEDIKQFLEGQYIQRWVEDGNEKVKLVRTGEPKANIQGRQAILSLFRSILNPQVVQGNFVEEQYYKFCELFHKKIAIMLMNNRYIWGIKSSDYPLIVTTLSNMTRAYMSRLINNKERDSYTNTMKMLETLRQEPLEKKGWKMPGFGGGE